MKLSLMAKRINGITMGSIVTDRDNCYPFGKVDEIINGDIFCYWYKTLDDLKNNRNCLKHSYSNINCLKHSYSNIYTYKTDTPLELIE